MKGCLKYQSWQECGEQQFLREEWGWEKLQRTDGQTREHQCDRVGNAHYPYREGDAGGNDEKEDER